MYAELFPSAQSLISSELEKVKLAVRAITVPTGSFFWNFPSPA